MEHTTNTSPTAATDEPAVPPTFLASDRPAARVSSRLTESLIEPALPAGADSRPGRATRLDGWTPDRIRIFLDALAECGVVGDAARAAGMSKQSAYNLRNRTAGRAFHVAWTAAEHLARRRIAGELMSRALHGCVEVIVRDGKVWGERHRFDNRLTLAVLDRLDRNVAARDDENKVARLVSEEFDQFVDIVCAGGEGAAADFVADRIEADTFTTAREARTLERCENYDRHGVGLPEEVEALDPRPKGRKRRRARPKKKDGLATMLESLLGGGPGDDEDDEDDEAGAKPEGEIGFIPGYEPVPEPEDGGPEPGGGTEPDEAPEPEGQSEAGREDAGNDDDAADVPAGAAEAAGAGEAVPADTLREASASAPPPDERTGAEPAPSTAEAAAAPAFDHYPGWVATD